MAREKPHQTCHMTRALLQLDGLYSCVNIYAIDTLIIVRSGGGFIDRNHPT
jgi:hypothetical protein